MPLKTQKSYLEHVSRISDHFSLHNMMQRAQLTKENKSCIKEATFGLLVNVSSSSDNVHNV